MAESGTALLYQPSCGISGDMHLAAMLHLGVPEELIRTELARLPLTGQFELQIGSGAKQGISGTQVRIKTSEQHHHRHHSHIAAMIGAAGFNAGVTRRALRIFELIAIAEARIHGVAVADVHFHEVGAVDSIVDIVAAAVCLDYLNPAHVYCAPVEVGAGFVDCAHGRFPVPAPATQELLVGLPCSYGGVQGESTTPTGAAILQASVTERGLPAGFAPAQTGYGVGHKDFELPNVLRVVRGTLGAGAGAEATESTFEHYKIEANIDDMSAEAFEPLCADLFAAGAGDVYSTPIVMKKSRVATCLTVLASADQADALADMLLNRSTTIGLRMIPFHKRVLQREQLSVPTSLGDVRVKRVRQPDGRLRWKSEHDDVARLASANALDYRSAKHVLDVEISGWLARDGNGTSTLLE